MDPSAFAESSSPPPASRLRAVFVGRKGIHAGWRLLIFVLLFEALATSVAWLVRHLLPTLAARLGSHPADKLTPTFTVATEAFLVFCLLIAVFAMSRIERRPMFSYGLARSAGFFRRFWLGLGVGLGGVSLQIALIAVSGGYSLGALALSPVDILKYGLLWAVPFLLTGIFEEFSLRGYLQVTLGDGIGFWPAAVLLAIGFASMHLANPGERWPGLAMLFCFAMLAAFTLWRTGDLWFIVGLHAAWDWSHVFLFSVPIAGFQGTHQLFHSSLRGPAWLTGGSVGPDGSVYAYVVLLVVAVFVHRVFFREGAPGAPHAAAGGA